MAGAAISIVDAEKPTLPTTEVTASQEAHPGSLTSFGVVYVNETAQQAMLQQKKPNFLVGSIIVRERPSSPDSTTPQLVSAMVKRQKGFNSSSGDWEFLVAESSAGKTQMQEKKVNCLSCHENQRESDFVFRTYLPEAVRLDQK